MDINILKHSIIEFEEDVLDENQNIINKAGDIFEITVKLKDLDSGEPFTYGIPKSNWGIASAAELTQVIAESHCNIAQTAFENHLSNNQPEIIINSEPKIKINETVFE